MDTLRESSSSLRNMLAENTICTSPFSATETMAIRAVTLTGASLSVLGAVFIIFSYVWFPRLRTFPYKLIVYLSIADLLSSVAYYIGLSEDSENQAECNVTSGCYVASVLTQVFDVSTFMWTAVIGFNIYAIFVQGKGRMVEHNERKYHMVAWGVPVVLALIVAAAGAYGDAGIWCWIKKDQTLVRFFCYYLPLIFVILYNMTNFCLVGRATRDTSDESAISFRLRMYLLVFIFVRIWGIIDRIQNALAPQPVFAFALLHSLFSPLQGFANSLVYGCNRQVINEYKYCLAPQNEEESFRLREESESGLDERIGEEQETEHELSHM